jgi:uncharacterized protein YjeT (DUF2065 family)
MDESVILALGLVLVLEGVGWAIAPQGMRSLVALLDQVSDRTMRVIGWVAMLIGFGLIWWAVT